MSTSPDGCFYPTLWNVTCCQRRSTFLTNAFLHDSTSSCSLQD